MTEPTVDVYLTEESNSQALRGDVVRGLSSTPKSLPPKWFYDATGSELFEEITALDEYYPFRAEHEILTDRAEQIAEVTGANTLVELGSGSSEKTRLLLDEMASTGALRQFVPLDVSESALRESARAIAAAYPAVTVHGVVADFTESLDTLPGTGIRAVAFLGGTVGNLSVAERAKFLSSVRQTLVPGEWLLLGTGLAIDPAVMVPAYDDAKGVTADFNRNVLRVLNSELGADFDPLAFEHVAKWNADAERIEMWLRATREMRVRLPGVGMEIEFADGEEMLTEISAKFRRETVQDDLGTAGFELEHFWTDRQDRFALSLARAAE
jgi:L-histidine N-alpha-methyltransferase